MQVTAMALERQLALWPLAVASGQTYRLVTRRVPTLGDAPAAEHGRCMWWVQAVEMRLAGSALYAVSALGWPEAGSSDRTA